MIYRFKIWFEEEEEIIRWIDIKPSHSFLDFHNAIIDSIQFDKSQPSSFYLSTDNWRKGKEISSIKKEGVASMEDSKLKDYINDPHQKFIFITDSVNYWTLFIELVSISEEKKNINYPNLFKSEGKAPKQSGGVEKLKLGTESEFDELATQMISERSPSKLTDPDDLESGFGEEGEEEEENEEDEFGEMYGDGLDSSDEY